MNYHKGVLCGLNQSIDQSAHFFSMVINNPDDRAWALELKNHVAGLIDIIRDAIEFKNRITKIVFESRIAKNLDGNMEIVILSKQRGNNT